MAVGGREIALFRILAIRFAQRVAGGGLGRFSGDGVQPQRDEAALDLGSDLR